MEPTFMYFLFRISMILIIFGMLYCIANVISILIKGEYFIDYINENKDKIKNKRRIKKRHKLRLKIEKEYDRRTKKQYKLRQKKRKEYNRKIKKYSKKSNSLSLSALRFEYSKYVKIVERILEEICDKTEVETNDLYLIKLDKYLKEVNTNKVYECTGCLYKAIKEFPVINEVDAMTKEKNSDFLKKLTLWL